METTQTQDLRCERNLSRLQRLGEVALSDEAITQQRDEIVSMMVEARVEQFVTEYTFEFDGDQVMAGGRAVQDMVKRDLELAKQEANLDPELIFYVRRSRADLKLSGLVNKMMCGDSDTDTIIAFSPYPEEVDRKVAQRKQYRSDTQRGLIWVWRKKSDTNVELTSVAVDHMSFDQMLNIYEKFGGSRWSLETTDDLVEKPLSKSLNPQEFDELRRELITLTIDDRSVIDQQTIEHAAGDVISYVASIERQLAQTEFLDDSAELSEFAFRSIQTKRPDGRLLLSRREQVLIEEALNTPSRLNTATVELLWKVLIYSSWALVDSRLDMKGLGQTNFRPVSQYQNPHNTVLEAGAHAAAMGRVMPSCPGGGGIGVLGEESGALNFSPFSYSSESKWSYSQGYCRDPKQLCPSRGTVTEVGPCQICRHCEKLF